MRRRTGLVGSHSPQNLISADMSHSPALPITSKGHMVASSGDMEPAGIQGYVRMCVFVYVSSVSAESFDFFNPPSHVVEICKI